LQISQKEQCPWDAGSMSVVLILVWCMGACAFGSRGEFGVRDVWKYMCNTGEKLRSSSGGVLDGIIQSSFLLPSISDVISHLFIGQFRRRLIYDRRDWR